MNTSMIPLTTLPLATLPLTTLSLTTLFLTTLPLTTLPPTTLPLTTLPLFLRMGISDLPAFCTSLPPPLINGQYLTRLRFRALPDRNRVSKMKKQ